MTNTLIISGHPSINESTANRLIIENLKTAGMQEDQIRDLSQLYPDYNINVKAEQEALLSADKIIFQFPFYWYSVPPILKQWIDAVFTYGEGGDKLKGKSFIVSTTTGTPLEAYRHDGMNKHTMEEFLYPVEQTAKLCNMNYAEPVCSHSMMAQDDISDIEKRADEHTQRLIQLIG